MQRSSGWVLRYRLVVASVSSHAKYSVLQDDYHERVARRFRLARGEKGSEVVHEAIDRAKAAEARERLAITETERAEAVTAQAYLDQIVAVDARDAAEAQRAAAVDEAERARRMAAEAEQYRTEDSRDAAAVVDKASIAMVAGVSVRWSWGSMSVREQTNRGRGDAISSRQT